MKLQDRFHQQAQETPSDMQKMRMYQQFLDKSHRSISYHKVTYYAKVAVFSLGLFILGGTVYYSAKPLSNTPYEIAQQGDGYTALQGRPGQFAQAYPIGQIISTAGAIRITNNNNVEIETKNLSVNDRVLLAEGAEMHFRIDDHIHAKISGPAEFALEDAGDQTGVKKYVINLISGDYLEVVTIPTEEERELPVSEAPVAQVTVKVADFTIEQVDTRGTLDLVISTTPEGKKQVANNGTEVVMKKIVAEKQTYVAIQQHETVAVNGSVEFVHEQATPEELLAKVEETKLTVRYEIERSASEDVLASETASDVLLTSATLSKKVISEELSNFIAGSLNTSALQRYIDQMDQYYTAGNKESFTIAYSNLLGNIARGYTLAGLAYTPIEADVSTLSTAAAAMTALVQELTASWYVNPSLLQGLQTTAISLRSFSSTLVIVDDEIEPEEVVDVSEHAGGTTTITIEQPEEETEDTIEGVGTEGKDDIQDESLEDLLQGVLDPTIPLQ